MLDDISSGGAKLLNLYVTIDKYAFNCITIETKTPCHMLDQNNQLPGLAPNQHISMSLKGVYYKILETKEGNMLEVLYAANRIGRSSDYSKLACVRAIYLDTDGNSVKLQVTGPFHMDSPDEEQNFLSIGLEHVRKYQTI